jgi:hypothetical protein
VRDAGEVAEDGVEGCGGVEEGRGKGAEARRELGVEAGVGGLEEPAAEFCIGDDGGAWWWWWSMGKAEGIWGDRGEEGGVRGAPTHGYGCVGLGVKDLLSLLLLRCASRPRAFSLSSSSSPAQQGQGLN